MKKEFLRLLPLLVILFALVGILSDTQMEGDEPRHIRYAKNLSQGFYEEAHNPIFDSAPGYPIVLAPFVTLNTPYIFPKLFNALLIFWGVWYFYQVLRLFLTEKHALIFAYLMGLYPPLIRWMPTLHSESLTFMLVCGFMFHFVHLMRTPHRHIYHLIWGTIFLGSMLVTRSIFAYVNLGTAGLYLGVYLLQRNQGVYKYVIGSLVVSILFLAPYLLYTYSKTGKPFLISTGGGSLLYFRSTPYDGEFGNWFSVDAVLNGVYPQKHKTYFDLTSLAENHQAVFEEIEPLNHIQRDSALTAKAVQNISNHPDRYIYNTLSSTLRLIFHYPFSYRPQGMETYGYLFPNMFIFVLGMFSIYPAIKAAKTIPKEIWFMLSYAMCYIGGHALLDGRGRYFIPIVPMLVLYLSYIYFRVVKFEIRTDISSE